jgi:cytoskeletal protein RodZ
MQNVGKWLQQAREAQELSLEDVEDVTKIRNRYLKALEVGDYEAIPGGEAQARGFLRRYAGFLGLSADEAISRYEQEHGREPATEALAQPQPDRTEPTGFLDLGSSRSSIWQTVAIVAIVIFIVIGAFWLISTFWINSPSDTAEEETPGTISLTPSQAALTTSPAEEVTPTFPVSQDEVTVMLESQEHVWVRVHVDGSVAFEGLLAPDSAQTWTGQEMVMVETGNGAGVTAVVNGQAQGAIGGRGELSARGWGPEGEVAVPSP